MKTLKLYNSLTRECNEITEFNLKCFVMRQAIETIASSSQPEIAFKCGVVSGEISKILSTLYTLEFQRSDYYKKYLEASLGVMSEIFETDMTEDKLRKTINEEVDSFLSQDFIFELKDGLN